MDMKIDSAADGTRAKLEIGTKGRHVSVVVTEDGIAAGVVFRDVESIKHLIRLLKTAAKKAGVW